MTVFQKLSESLDLAHCIFDSEGKVISISSKLEKLLEIEKVKNPTIFHISGEMSFLSWQNFINKQTPTFIESRTILVINEKVPKEFNVTHYNFTIEGQPYCFYAVEPPLKKSNTKTESKANGPESPFNYDEQSSNMVLYFNEKGKITYLNSLAEQHQIKEQSMENLFLEPEMGPLPESILTLDAQKEHLIRMIMKTGGGLKEGYSKISILPSQDKSQNFRIEFVFSEKLNLVDFRLDEAMSEVKRLKTVLSDKKEILVGDSIEEFSFENIITRSKKYKTVLREVAQVADTNSTVLITGETGTGKEMLCNVLYKLSDRSNELIVKVNCATIPENLIESILFGHEKGAFTDANQLRIGKFELANKGTLFLDEIGEMPYEMQSKLLRVLQEGEIERIGNPTPIKVDVRIIAATNRDLEKLVQKKKFRSDLYYRLNVFPIYNIPLRERKEDIEPLVKHFIKKANKKTGRNIIKVLESDVKALEAYDFPGNIRELENIIERSVISSEGETLTLNFFSRKNSSSAERESGMMNMKEMEKNHIIKALKLSNGKVTGNHSASELLNINGKTLVSKIKRLKINPKNYIK